MYFNYYHLSEAPFALVPNSSQIYIDEPQYQVLGYLNRCLDDDGISVLTGSRGIGKSLLLKLFKDQLEDDKIAILINNSSLSIHELYQYIAEALSLKYHGQKGDLKTIVTRVRDKLLQQLKLETQIVLLIDNADLLSDALLNELRFLDNLDQGGKKLLKLIMVGEDSLYERLQEPQFLSLSQRVSTRYIIQPLNEKQSQNYIEQQLVYVDGSLDLLSPKALKLIIKNAQGIPHWINTLSDHALNINYLNYLSSSEDSDLDLDEEEALFGTLNVKPVEQALKQVYFNRLGRLFQLNKIENNTPKTTDKLPTKKERNGILHFMITTFLGVISLLLFLAVLLWSYVQYPNFYQQYKEMPIIKQMIAFIPLSRTVQESNFKWVPEQAETKIELLSDANQEHQIEANLTSDRKDPIKTDLNKEDLNKVEVSQIEMLLPDMANALAITQIYPQKRSWLEFESSPQKESEIIYIVQSAQANHSDVTETPTNKNTDLNSINGDPSRNTNNSSNNSSSNIEKTVNENENHTDSVDIDIIANNIAHSNSSNSEEPDERMYNIALFSIVFKDLAESPIDKMIDDLVPDDASLAIHRAVRGIPDEPPVIDLKNKATSEQNDTPENVSEASQAGDPIESLINAVLEQDRKHLFDEDSSKASASVDSNSKSSASIATTENLSSTDGNAFKSPVLNLDQLPPNIRKALPSLHFQSHVYTQNFKYNWVKVNNKVLYEGDMINNHVQLIRIDSESNVIYFQDKLIRIPALTAVDP